MFNLPAATLLCLPQNIFFFSFFVTKFNIFVGWVGWCCVLWWCGDVVVLSGREPDSDWEPTLARLQPSPVQSLRTPWRSINTGGKGDYQRSTWISINIVVWHSPMHIHTWVNVNTAKDDNVQALYSISLSLLLIALYLSHADCKSLQCCSASVPEWWRAAVPYCR